MKLAAIESPTIPKDGMLARAIETDRLYFEMGANCRTLTGAVMAWMPGVSASPGAAVVHRVDPAQAADAGEGWVAEVEGALKGVGASLARIYLDTADGPLGGLLRGAGYVEREELVFAGSMPAPSGSLRLIPVTSDADWERKLQFYREADSTPDGHDNDASDWVALERSKCAHGMEAFLAEQNGQVVGTIGAIRGESVLRLKNLVIHPAHRRRKVGRALLAEAAGLGLSSDLAELCVLAVKGEAGECFYRAIGLRPVGAQVEWSKRIGGAR